MKWLVIIGIVFAAQYALACQDKFGNFDASKCRDYVDQGQLATYARGNQPCLSCQKGKNGPVSLYREEGQAIKVPDASQ
jgi:hypothetical protein